MVRIIIDIDGENVKVRTEKKETSKIGSDQNVSQYARFFDEGCVGWEKDSEHNLMFLKHQQMYANDKLKQKGHLFLNEVYDMLGIPRTRAGAIVGWVYDEERPIGDNYVDFGLERPEAAKFVNGLEPTILLDFNVDGDILSYLE